jgi:serine-type D-Ala-D-Ala carboxypeptidase/endopeptidase (penicillin-binding protein 4)
VRRGLQALILPLAVAGPALVAAQPAVASAPDEAASTPIAASGEARAASGSISRQRLRRGLERRIGKAGPSSGAWVYDAGANRRPKLFGSGAGERRILASNTKLFTTATALGRLGRARRLQTSIWRQGRIERGVLGGSLYLVGDGDPALASPSFARRHNLPLTRLANLARDVREDGIRRVRGRIYVDDTIFDRRRGVPASGYRVSRYIGPLSGLSYNSGRSGPGFARSPEREAGNALRRALRKKGVRVEHRVRRREVPRRVRRRPRIGAVRSLKLSELVDETNTASNNFFAEMLLKRLAAKPGRRGTTRTGARAVRRFARRLGTRIRASDGSGLGRRNRASPKQVGKLLVAMRDHRARRAFVQSLPVAGREGTVRHRMRGTAAEGRCRTKTGTLTEVSALSGYCDAGHDAIAFSILMNGVDVDRARELQDRMAALIARYRP